MKALILMLVFSFHAAWATLPQICGPTDESCPIPTDLLLSCGDVSGVELFQDKNAGGLHGRFFASSTCGGNGIRAMLNHCSPHGAGYLCSTDHLSDCSGEDVKAAQALHVRFESAPNARRAIAEGLESVRDQLNPLNPTLPLSFVCLSRRELIQKELDPQNCKLKGSTVPTIVTHFTMGFQTFLIEGKVGASNMNCGGQMFAATAKGSEFVLQKNDTCPYEWASVGDTGPLELGCFDNHCSTANYECAKQN